MPSLQLISATDTQYCTSVLKSMNEQRSHGLFCDVTIIIRDKKFRAHKTVLSASSVYFQQLFSVAGQVIELNFVRADIFEEILNYIYSSKICCVRSDMLEELISAGQVLGVKFIANLAPLLSQVNGLSGRAKETENKNVASSEVLPTIAESFSISADQFKQTSKVTVAPIKSRPAKLRVILQDHDIRRLDLHQGLPSTVGELESAVGEKFGLRGKFMLHYKDSDFGEEYFSLTSTSDVKDKDTIKVVEIVEQPTFTLNLTEVNTPFESEVNPSFEREVSTPFGSEVSTPFEREVSTPFGSEISTPFEREVNTLFGSEPEIFPCSAPTLLSDATSTITGQSSCFSSSQDTPSLLSDCGTQRLERWPAEFPIPRFGYDTELMLAAGNEAHKNNAAPLNVSSVLSDILERLAECVFQYVAYPSSSQLTSVAKALIQKHPCLTEAGSHNGCYGWHQRLKYKMANYRSKLRGLGCPELDVNSLRQKRPHDRAAAKNVKKPKKSEVNFLPPHPPGETEESLEGERRELLHEVTKTNNSQIISEKMAKTFSLRRQEVVNQELSISDLKQRWPALFSAAQINQEFKRITTVNLETTFLANLDQYSLKILSLLSSRGGAAKMRILQLQNILLKDSSVETRREVAIRGLMACLREKEEDLFKHEAGDEDATGQGMKIITPGGIPAAHAKIVLNGTEVLMDVVDIPRACALLMGLIYAFNLSYPKELKYTFEVFQKIFLELDDLKASPKVMTFKIKLLC